MKNFIDATRTAINSKNWYAALALALTVPDICGRLEDPSTKSSEKRYIKWYNKYMLNKYEHEMGPANILHTFLGGSDLYALRCAYLHQGEFGINEQGAKKVLEHFHFTAPRPGFLIHNNYYEKNGVLQLQVDCFCLDVCEAVEQWLQDVKGDKDIQNRIASLATIG